VAEAGESPERFGLGAGEVRFAQRLAATRPDESMMVFTISCSRRVDASNSLKERRCEANCAFSRANCDDFGMDVLQVIARYLNETYCVQHYGLQSCHP
jgi:hypothetical protein